MCDDADSNCQQKMTQLIAHKRLEFILNEVDLYDYKIWALESSRIVSRRNTFDPMFPPSHYVNVQVYRNLLSNLHFKGIHSSCYYPRMLGVLGKLRPVAIGGNRRFVQLLLFQSA